MKKIILLFLSRSLKSHAIESVWPGEGGKICLDTPRPTKFSGQDYKMAADYGPTHGKNREELVKKIESRRLLYQGPLSAQVDEDDPLELPEGKGAYISGLDTAKAHTLKIKGKDGKKQETIKFTFEKRCDERIRI